MSSASVSGTGNGSARFDGALLARVRKDKGLTQVELASLVGYEGVATISKIESGSRQPSPRKWIELAEALGVEPVTFSVKAGKGSLAPTDDELLPDGPQPKRSGLSRHVALLDAAQQAKENQARIKVINEAVTRLDEETEKRVEEWTATKDHLEQNVLTPFYQKTRQIEGIGTSADQIHAGLDTESLTPRMRLEHQRSDLQRSIVGIAGSAAASAGLGAAAGAGAAYAAYAATAAWATASTGAAISGLSGAAATSATLAALGGGSLAAGGLGVAGGAMVLTSIITAPVLIAAGVAVIYKGGKLRAKTRSEAAAIAAAEIQLRKTTKTLTQVWTWIDQTNSILRVATATGEDEIDWLAALLQDKLKAHAGVAAGESSPKVEWRSLTGLQQDRYEELTSLIATIINVITAPLVAIADNELPREEIDDITEWNELVLKDSAERLGVQIA